MVVSLALSVSLYRQGEGGWVVVSLSLCRLLIVKVGVAGWWSLCLLLPAAKVRGTGGVGRPDFHRACRGLGPRSARPRLGTTSATLRVPRLCAFGADRFVVVRGFDA